MLTITNPAEATYNNPYETILANALTEAARNNTHIQRLTTPHETAVVIRFTNGDKVLITDQAHCPVPHLTLTWIQADGTVAAGVLPHTANDYYNRVVIRFNAIAYVALQDHLTGLAGEPRITAAERQRLTFMFRGGRFH